MTSFWNCLNVWNTPGSTAQYSRNSSSACVSSQYFWKDRFPEQEWKTLHMVWSGNKVSNIVTEKQNPDSQNPWREEVRQTIIAEVTLLECVPCFLLSSGFRRLSGEGGSRHVFAWNTTSQEVMSSPLLWHGTVLKKTNGTWIIKTSSIITNPNWPKQKATHISDSTKWAWKHRSQ